MRRRLEGLVQLKSQDNPINVLLCAKDLVFRSNRRYQPGRFDHLDAMLDLQSSRRVGHEWVGVEGRVGAAPVLDASHRVAVADIAAGVEGEAGTVVGYTLVVEVGHTLGYWMQVGDYCPCALEACSPFGHQILGQSDRNLVDLGVAYIAVALVAESYIAVPVSRHRAKMEIVGVVRGMRLEEADEGPSQCSRSHPSSRGPDALGRISADHLVLGRSTSLACLS